MESVSVDRGVTLVRRGPVWHLVVNRNGERYRKSLATLDRAKAVVIARQLGEQERVPLGLSANDAAIGGGVLPGWVTTVGAFTSGGKTSLCCAIAASLALRGHPVFFFTAECSRFEIAQKIAAMDEAAKYETLDLYDFSRDLAVVEHALAFQPTIRCSRRSRRSRTWRRASSPRMRPGSRRCSGSRDRRKPSTSSSE